MGRKYHPINTGKRQLAKWQKILATDIPLICKELFKNQGRKDNSPKKYKTTLMYMKKIIVREIKTILKFLSIRLEKSRKYGNTLAWQDSLLVRMKIGTTLLEENWTILKIYRCT